VGTSISLDEPTATSVISTDTQLNYRIIASAHAGTISPPLHLTTNPLQSVCWACHLNGPYIESLWGIIVPRHVIGPWMRALLTREGRD
jgi:hypothetical protein